MFVKKGSRCRSQEPDPLISTFVASNSSTGSKVTVAATHRLGDPSGHVQVRPCTGLGSTKIPKHDPFVRFHSVCWDLQLSVRRWGGGGPHLPRAGRWLLGAVIPLHSGFLTGQKVRLRGRFGPSLSVGLHEAARVTEPLVRPTAAGVSGVRHDRFPRGGGRNRVVRRGCARPGPHLRLHHHLGREEKVPGGPDGQGQQQGPVQAEPPSLGPGVLQFLHRRDHDPLGLIADVHVCFDYRPGRNKTTNKQRWAWT